MAKTGALPIAVVGSATARESLAQTAREVGKLVASQGYRLVCGGRGGVMEWAALGAREAGGETLGILPGKLEEGGANSQLDWAVYTDLGQARNQIIVQSAAAVVAVGGGWGTLSEIALALKHRIPVILLESFSLQLPDGTDDALLHTADSAADAVRLAIKHARRKK